MQFYIEEHHTSNPLAQFFVPPHHVGFSPFDRQESHLYCYDRSVAAAIEHQHQRLLIERELALERARQRQRQRRRAFLLQKIAEEERQQAELERYYQWQLKRHLEQQQQAELLERQRRLQQQQQQRDQQERYAKMISSMLCQFWTEDEDQEMEESQSRHEQEQDHTTTTTTVEHRSIPVDFVEDTNDNNSAEEGKEESENQQQEPEPEPEQEQEHDDEVNDHIQGYIVQQDDQDEGARSVHNEETPATTTPATNDTTMDEDDTMWEQVNSSSDDEGDLGEKHERLRLIGEQLAQLSEKHASTLATTRLQFADDVNEVTAISAENRQFLGLEDEVMQTMLQLDSIQSGGSEVIRKERKALIQQAEKLLAIMDEHKQHEWERISVQSTPSEDEAVTTLSQSA